MSDESALKVNGKEEASWAKVHQAMEARALAAFENGTVRPVRMALRLPGNAAKSDAASLVELDPEDAQQAIKLAARRGMEYPEFVKMLVHEALQREDQNAA